MKNNLEELTIYCDESGFTGDDLLKEDQPYFIYSAVNMTEKNLTEIKDYIERNYNLQGGEIKGKNIVTRAAGQKVIKYIFEKYAHLARLVFHDKKYALAGKLVEYGIEPYLKSNELFYKSELHIYLASGFYLDLKLKHESAERLFEDFVALARRQLTFEDSLFASKSKLSGQLNWMFEIIRHKPEIMLNELNYDDTSPQSNWLLDLTTTSLFGLLTEWSKNNEILEVICDDSKVFNNSSIIESYNSMGLNNRRSDFLGTPIGFNLKKDIVNKSSKDEIGLQIADLFSATLNYCLKNRELEFSKSILKIVHETCICTPESFCLMPTIQENVKEYTDEKLVFYHQFMYKIYVDAMSL
ncbi:MAG: hypothetical protein K0S23_1224 [Fluviicola sp.]|uniref:DUF3800 domain-containing protein n=1 Tax=Fluviicola sp. TaxID=1917219 RepID=UPI002638B0E7|nr:DUF3800 domain-containing protein [Fluviicola sp.]MDF3026917.1 hypothetical protein [Fluviicola sp.]